MKKNEEIENIMRNYLLEHQKDAEFVFTVLRKNFSKEEIMGVATNMIEQGVITRRDHISWFAAILSGEIDPDKRAKRRRKVA